MIIRSSLFQNPSVITMRAIEVLDKLGAKMHFNDIAVAIKAAGWSNNGASSTNTVERELFASTERPEVFHALVRLGDGFYASSNKPSVTPAGPPSFDGHPLNLAGFHLTDVEADEREEAILKTLRGFLIWAEREGKLSGKLALSRLVNMSWQTGHLDVLVREHQEITLKELVPHLRRALHEEEWEDRTGHPVHVWADPEDGTFMMGSEAPDLSRLLMLKAQNGAAFSSTVKATLEHMGATEIAEVRNDRTVMFRAILRGQRVAVSAYQDFAPVDQIEVQSLRGALDQYEEEGLIFSLGTVSEEAHREIGKPKSKVIKHYGVSHLLATLARQPATAPTV